MFSHKVIWLPLTCLFPYAVSLYTLKALFFILVVQQKDRKDAGYETAIKLLLENPSKEMSQLIKEAQEQYDGEYSYLYLSTFLICLISSFYSSLLPEYISDCLSFFFQLYPQIPRFTIY